MVSSREEHSPRRRPAAVYLWLLAGIVGGLLGVRLVFPEAWPVAATQPEASGAAPAGGSAQQQRPAVALGATAATFSGVILNAGTKAPVPGARVTFGSVSVIGDASGHYTLTTTAAKAFHATASAPGYLSVVVDLSLNGSLISGAVHWDFAGPYALKALGNLTAVLSGVVRDSQSSVPVGGAAVTVVGAQAIADAAGRYTITVPSATRIQVQATAQGYQWRSPLSLSMPDHSVVQGQIPLDFSGSSGLESAFLTPQHDTLTRFNQIIPATGRSLRFSGWTSQPLEERYAVTFPNGDADLGPLKTSAGQYGGQLPFRHGKGTYQLEINASNGFAIFNLPVYYGVAYKPPPIRPQYPATNPKATPAQLAAQALRILNRLRTRYHRPVFEMTAPLQQEAQAHSRDVMVHSYYDQHPHVGSDNSQPQDRVAAAHVAYQEMGEDVAADTSVNAAIDGLMMSPGHRANILFPGFTKVGIGVARQTEGLVILTIDFVEPSGTLTAATP